jgi:hypothetical protein
MRRRRNREPDTRLNWRDPDMPVLRPWEDRWGKVYIREIPPEEESEYCTSMVNNNNPNAPSWRNDPTYNLAKRRRRR